MNRAHWLVLLLVVAFPVYSGSDIQNLEDRHQKNIASPEGQAYEMKAVQAFWGDAHFMSECVPPKAPMPEPLTIYFEVKKDGRMGALVSDPNTTVAKCIMKKVRNRRFPTPPSEFVVRIDLAFTK